MFENHLGFELGATILLKNIERQPWNLRGLLM